MASGDSLIAFLPRSATPPSSAAASFDRRNGKPVIDFDGSTDEEMIFEGVLPANYGGSGITVDCYVTFTSATSGTARLQSDFERGNAGGSDIDADSFSGAFQSAGGTANATSGIKTKISIAHTNVQLDGLAAGEPFRLKIRRDADGTSGTDDIPTDLELHEVVLRET